MAKRNRTTIEHRENIRNKRRKAPKLERAQAHREIKPHILIVCEGQNTEPSYFNKFRLSSATIKALGEGYNTISLVERTVKIAEQGQYDQVWCVFDKDDFDDNNFNSAIEKANSLGYKVAYSNQAFEYWLILHFDDHQGAKMHRNQYNKRLNQLLSPFNITYDGNGIKIINDDFFEILESIDDNTNQRRIDLAIKRAKRNYNKLDHSSPAKEESSTTIFKLVEELNKYI